MLACFYALDCAASIQVLCGLDLNLLPLTLPEGRRGWIVLWLVNDHLTLAEARACKARALDSP